MAGRGTDIKLGEGVRELGGLAVIGSVRTNPAVLIISCAAVRAVKGDPGYSRFGDVSVQDDLMVRFGSEKMESLFSQLGDVPIESKVVTKSIGSAQKRVEGVNFDVRKTLLEYDDVLRQQREIIYEQRNFILDHEDVHSIVKDMFDRVVSNLVSAHTEHDGKEEKVNTAELLESLGKMGFHEV